MLRPPSPSDKTRLRGRGKARIDQDRLVTKTMGAYHSGACKAKEGSAVDRSNWNEVGPPQLGADRLHRASDGAGVELHEIDVFGIAYRRVKGEFVKGRAPTERDFAREKLVRVQVDERPAHHKILGAAPPATPSVPPSPYSASSTCLPASCKHYRQSWGGQKERLSLLVVRENDPPHPLHCVRPRDGQRDRHLP